MMIIIMSRFHIKHVKVDSDDLIIKALIYLDKKYSF